jgi:ATP-dependent helicase/DNAse subunit B
MDVPQTFHLDFVKPPTFNPHIERRPKQLSATNIEKLMKNPYEFFVNKVLNLRPLDNISQPFNKALYGTVLHGVFELFFLDVQKYQGKSAMELFAIIHKIALKEFHFLSHNVSFKMFYEPKINYVLQEFLEHQIDVIAKIQQVELEIEGRHSINIAGTTLTLTGKADRIDISHNNDMTIVDYKTTSKKGATQHKLKEYQYQLAILTWILENNGFPNIVNGFNSVEAQYLFLPNKYQKEHIEIVKNDYSIEPVITTLEKYYKDVVSYNFTDNKDIDKAYLHFARFEEWNKELIEQEEESND